MKKRIIAVIMAGVMLFSVAACDASEDNTKVKTLFNGGVEVNDTSTNPEIVEGNTVKMPTMYYDSFTHDPITFGENAALACKGWQKSNVDLNLDKIAIVVAHAATFGQPEESPNQFAYGEYGLRSYRIAQENFPGLLDAAREAGIKIYHVPFGEGYYEDLPGFIETKALQAPVDMENAITADNDDSLNKLRGDWYKLSAMGDITWNDLGAEREKNLNFLPEAFPVGNEPIVQTSNELAAVAKRDGVNHLLYIGFAVDHCLLTSPGGMNDMIRRGFFCSAIADCVTAVENRESVLSLHHTETALWRVDSLSGFVYESKDLINGFNLIKNKK